MALQNQLCHQPYKRVVLRAGQCYPAGVVVKICGITNLPDALAATEAGADALGFVFCEESPRCISPEVSATIIRTVPPFIVKVGVFVNPSTELVQSAISAGVTLLQFHGEETPDFCLQFGLMSMKAFRIRDASSLEGLTAYKTDAWLLDAFVSGQRGGTGASFNWELAAKARALGRPLFLAGGLTPSNVAEAVRKVAPYGVDVSSGVEALPGKKDIEKVKAFIQAAKAAAATQDSPA